MATPPSLLIKCNSKRNCASKTHAASIAKYVHSKIRDTRGYVLYFDLNDDVASAVVAHMVGFYSYAAGTRIPPRASGVMSWMENLSKRDNFFRVKKLPTNIDRTIRIDALDIFQSYEAATETPYMNLINDAMAANGDPKQKFLTPPISVTAHANQMYEQLQKERNGAPPPEDDIKMEINEGYLQGDPRDVRRGQHMDLGSAVHRMAECYLHGSFDEIEDVVNGLPENLKSHAWNKYSSFVAAHFTICEMLGDGKCIASEHKLESPLLGRIGRLDALYQGSTSVDGSFAKTATYAIVDWKTTSSQSIKQQHLSTTAEQLRAYSEMLEGVNKSWGANYKLLAVYLTSSNFEIVEMRPVDPSTKKAGESPFVISVVSCVEM